MGLRRIGGSGLVAVLLLGIALPAFCGECHRMTKEAACAESHTAATNRHENRSASMDANCQSCDVQGLSAKTQSRHEPVSELIFLSCSQRSCEQLTAQSFAVNVEKWSPAQRGDQAGFKISVAVLLLDHASRSVHPNSFRHSKTASLNSAYRPLSVSLKI
jgi:hypothetical protein